MNLLESLCDISWLSFFRTLSSSSVAHVLYSNHLKQPHNQDQAFQSVFLWASIRYHWWWLIAKQKYSVPCCWATVDVSAISTAVLVPAAQSPTRIAIILARLGAMYCIYWRYWRKCAFGRKAKGNSHDQALETHQWSPKISWGQNDAGLQIDWKQKGLSRGMCKDIFDVTVTWLSKSYPQKKNTPWIETCSNPESNFISIQ